MGPVLLSFDRTEADWPISSWGTSVIIDSWERRPKEDYDSPDWPHRSQQSEPD
jgi:hypothetical protein